MARIPDSTVAEAVGKTADPLDELVPDYTPLMRLIGDARFPLLGEASHGTHEFYRERARITKRLIEQHEVLAVAIEGDWPDAARVNRYVRGAGDDAHADDALADFRRFPTWMWRNTEVVEFVEWLRLHNEALPPDAPRVGFYGLDLYSLRASMEAVLRYLEKTDPAVAERARTRYACFDRFGDDPRTYGFLTSTGLEESCQQEVVEQLASRLRCRLVDVVRGAAARSRAGLENVDRIPSSGPDCRRRNRLRLVRDRRGVLCRESHAALSPAAYFRHSGGVEESIGVGLRRIVFGAHSVARRRGVVTPHFQLNWHDFVHGPVRHL